MSDSKTLSKAEQWCLWNGRKIEMPDAWEHAEVGLELWRARFAAGLDPVTGEPSNRRRRKP